MGIRGMKRRPSSFSELKPSGRWRLGLYVPGGDDFKASIGFPRSRRKDTAPVGTCERVRYEQEDQEPEAMTYPAISGSHEYGVFPKRK